MTIRAVVRDGTIYPLEPLPEDWHDGQEVQVEPSPPDDPEEIERWYAELKALSPAQYDPGERERIDAIMAQADEQQKAIVRRQMGLS